VWNNPWFRSTSVKLSALYAALVITSFLFVGVVIWLTARHSAEKELRQNIELEFGAIQTELETEGLAATIAAIDARAAHPGALEYWFAGPDGARLWGDFPQMSGPDGWRFVTIDDARGGAGREELLVMTRTLPGGSRLSVGDELRRARAVQHAVLRTLATVGTVTALLCLVVGVFATRRMLSRVKALSTTFEKVMAGDIAARFPATGPSSDVEQIGIGVNRMLDRIELLIADVRRVSRDVAHDLRTPLTHLQRRLEVAMHATSPAERLAAVEGAQQKAAEVLRIFDAIVRLAEIEAGAGRQRFRRVDLAAIAERVADAYRPDIEQAGHTLAVHVAGPCPVHGDEDLLSQAIANLVENATRHTPAGTHIEVCVPAAGTTHGIEVIDNGPGVPAHAFELIQKPFTRLDESRTTPGSGLGLSLVAAIARLHHARLTISDAGPGLRVCLAFAGDESAEPVEQLDLGQP
jgi:signal transduction histidine kinase